MAVLKNPESTSLVLEIESGVDSKGITTYRKKTFLNIDVTASDENIYAVATAIASVLEKATRDYLIKNTGKLVNQG